MRKTPYKHPVKAHTRSGYPVINYVRGRGNQPKGRTLPRKVVGVKPPKNLPGDAYEVQIFYAQEPTETFRQTGPSYAEIINPSLLRRKSPKNPITMTLEEIP